MLIQLLSTPAPAGNCPGNCAPAVAQLAKKEGELGKIRDILAKNEEYLKRNPSVSPSIAVKIRSNIMISKLQIETAQNEKVLLEASLEKQGCKECKKITNAASKT
jgi:hypothetical protein